MENEDSQGLWPSSEGPSKRIRQTNYTADEKSLLLQLVQKYSHILTNKKTDAVNNNRKEDCWRKVGIEFNAISPNSTYRDAASLKKAYLNIKKNVRKDVADERAAIIKTGGGIAHQKQDPLREMALQTMNGKTVFGHQNMFDSDGAISLGRAEQKLPLEQNNSSYNDFQVDENSEPEEIDNVENILIYQIPEAHSAGVEVSEDEPDWGKWRSQDLRKPLHKTLSNRINSVYKTRENAATGASITNNPEIPAQPVPALNKSRRRPAAMALHSSELGKIYTKLAEEKLELVNMEKAAVQQKKASDAIKQELEIEILRIQLAIRKEELRKLTQ